MATKPAQGGSTGTWGTELNAHLEVEHDTKGNHTYFVCNEDHRVCNVDSVVSNPSTY